MGFLVLAILMSQPTVPLGDIYPRVAVAGNKILVVDLEGHTTAFFMRDEDGLKQVTDFEPANGIKIVMPPEVVQDGDREIFILDDVERRRQWSIDKEIVGYSYSVDCGILNKFVHGVKLCVGSVVHKKQLSFADGMRFHSPDPAWLARGRAPFRFLVIPIMDGTFAFIEPYRLDKVFIYDLQGKLVRSIKLRFPQEIKEELYLSGGKRKVIYAPGDGFIKNGVLHLNVSDAGFLIGTHAFQLSNGAHVYSTNDYVAHEFEDGVFLVVVEDDQEYSLQLHNPKFKLQD